MVAGLGLGPDWLGWAPTARLAMLRCVAPPPGFCVTCPGVGHTVLNVHRCVVLYCFQTLSVVRHSWPWSGHQEPCQLCLFGISCWFSGLPGVAATTALVRLVKSMCFGICIVHCNWTSDVERAATPDAIVDVLLLVCAWPLHRALCALPCGNRFAAPGTGTNAMCLRNSATLPTSSSHALFCEGHVLNLKYNRQPTCSAQSDVCGETKQHEGS
jgi:hypothetical protein